VLAQLRKLTSSTACHQQCRFSCPIRAASAAVGATSAMRRRPTGGWVDHPIGSQLGALGALRPGLFDRLGDMRFSEVFVADLCQKNILLGCRPPDEADAGLSGAAKRGPGSGTSCPGRAGRIVRPRRPPNRRSLRCARRAWSWPSRSPRQCQVLSSSGGRFPAPFWRCSRERTNTAIQSNSSAAPI